MARSRSGRSADTNVDARAVQALLRPVAPRPLVIPTEIVTQDERFYSPVRPVPPLLPGGRPARLQQSPNRTLRRGRIRFQSPAALDICRKRKDRREVIFAKGKSGKGARAKFRKQHFYSEVSCK